MATNWAELNGGDDDDDALRRAIAMSLGEVLPEEGTGPSHPDRPNNTSQPGRSPVKAVASAASSMAALGLDRKAMEEARLARSRKRKAEAGGAADTSCPDAHGPPTRRPRLLDVPSTTRTQGSIQTTGPSLNSMSHSLQQGPAGPRAQLPGRLPYAQGAVLRTWTRGRPREQDITIEEVLQKDDLELAVLSSFQWDEDWLLGKLDMRRTKVLLIAYAKDDMQVGRLRRWGQTVLSEGVPLPVSSSCLKPACGSGECLSAADLFNRKPTCATTCLET